MKTIREIAEEAKVSTGTVDRVIHNRSGVSQATRERVKKIIHESDFKLNPVARSLALKKDYRIGILIPSSNETLPFWQDPKDGINEAVAEIENLGISIENYYFNAFDNQDFQKKAKKLLTAAPNAVLLAPIFNKEALAFTSQLDQLKIPYLCINTELKECKRLCFIGQDAYKAGKLAAKLLHILVASTAQKGTITIVDFRKDLQPHSAVEQRVDGFITNYKVLNPGATIQKISVESIAQLSEIIKNQSPSQKPIGWFVPASQSHKVAEIVDNQENDHIPLVGFDLTPPNLQYLQMGKIDFLIGQQGYTQGFNGIKILSDFLIQNKIPPTHQFSRLEIFTKENVDDIQTN